MTKIIQKDELLFQYQVLRVLISMRAYTIKVSPHRAASLASH